jgi:hypothetical protein
MNKNLLEGDLVSDPDAGSVRPAPLRKAARTKTSTRSRKRRRVTSPGGIHQRANKRMSW